EKATRMFPAETLFRDCLWWARQVPELRCMTRDELQSRTKKVLAEMARSRGIVGWHRMRKEELVEALLASEPRKEAVTRAPRPQPQPAAARNTSGNGNGSAEEKIESSKYDVGVPTRDLSAKVPRDLPAGVGNVRSGAMVPRH